MSNPPAIIVDLDGTLALPGQRSPYDYARCGEDLPNDPVVALVRHYARGTFARGDYVSTLIVSGRDESCREETLAWLDRYLVPVTALFLRPVGDARQDAVYKQALYTTAIAPAWDVRFVLEDRTRVVAMWRALGLVCLQVANGDF